MAERDTKYTRIKQRRDTKENWENINPILLKGELGLEYDENNQVVRFKIGNGSTQWNELPYFYDKTSFDKIKNEIKDGTVPENHSSLINEYGEGTKDEYGHVRITGADNQNKWAIGRIDVGVINDLDLYSLIDACEYSIKFTKDCLNIPKTLLEDLNLSHNTDEIFEGILINYNISATAILLSNYNFLKEQFLIVKGLIYNRNIEQCYDSNKLIIGDWSLIKTNSREMSSNSSFYTECDYLVPIGKRPCRNDRLRHYHTGIMDYSDYSLVFSQRINKNFTNKLQYIEVQDYIGTTRFSIGVANYNLDLSYESQTEYEQSPIWQGATIWGLDQSTDILYGISYDSYDLQGEIHIFTPVYNNEHEIIKYSYLKSFSLPDEIYGPLSEEFFIYDNILIFNNYLYFCISRTNDYTTYYDRLIGVSIDDLGAWNNISQWSLGSFNYNTERGSMVQGIYTNNTGMYVCFYSGKTVSGELTETAYIKYFDFEESAIPQGQDLWEWPGEGMAMLENLVYLGADLDMFIAYRNNNTEFFSKTDQKTFKNIKIRVVGYNEPWIIICGFDEPFKLGILKYPNKEYLDEHSLFFSETSINGFVSMNRILSYYNSYKINNEVWPVRFDKETNRFYLPNSTFDTALPVDEIQFDNELIYEIRTIS